MSLLFGALHTSDVSSSGKQHYYAWDQTLNFVRILKGQFGTECVSLDYHDFWLIVEHAYYRLHYEEDGDKVMVLWGWRNFWSSQASIPMSGDEQRRLWFHRQGVMADIEAHLEFCCVCRHTPWGRAASTCRADLILSPTVSRCLA